MARAGDLLAESERRGVVQVRAADLDDVRKLFGFDVESVAQLLYRRQKTPRGFRGSGDVHGGWKGVVGGLRHVDGAVRVNRFLAAHYAAGNFDVAVGNDSGPAHVGL